VTAVVQAAAIPIQPPPLAPAVRTTAPRRLAINAFPWATIASIRNVENGEAVEIGAKLVTPATIEVAPGRYELTLTNPHHARAITRTVTVANGEDAALTVHFTDPARATLPDFGGAR
jgi:hypothetical protein